MSKLDPLVSELLQLVFSLVESRTPRVLTLDELGELIGDRAISPVQIDQLIGHLESDGIAVSGEENVDLVMLLRKVIQAAGALRKADKPAGPKAIARESGLSHGAVKLALLYSEVIRKPN